MKRRSDGVLHELKLAELTRGPGSIAVFEFDWRQPGYGSRRQVCDFISVSIHEGGDSLVWRDEPIEVGRLHAVVMGAGQPHQVLDFGTASGVAVAFLPAVLANRRALLDDVLALAPVKLTRALLDQSTSLTRSIGRHLAAGERHGGVLAEAALLELLVTLVASSPLSGPRITASPLSSRALAFIEARHAQPISLRDAAKACDCNPRHLASVVARDTGRSVGNWLTLFRVAHAREVLRHSDRAIEEVGLEVGYGDVTHFIRVFKRSEGLTPAGFRRACARPGEGRTTPGHR
jgi:AraC family transcriptional regulator, transcriptional activator of pobA